MRSGDSFVVFLPEESRELCRDTLPLRLPSEVVPPLVTPPGERELRQTLGDGTGTLLQFRSCS